MMKEEDIIRKKCGAGNPFRVPEGYFEHFTSDLMARLPEKAEGPASATPLRRPRRTLAAWYAAAAVLCGAMFLGGYHLRHNRAPQAAPMAQTLSATEAEDTYMDDVLDYAMVSNHEIALYLTDAY